MKALVLEKKLELSLRNIDLPTELGDSDVKIKMHTVGICGSDVHYYQHGKIGPFEVKEPMDKVPMDFATLLTKEIEIKTVFRYAHQYDRAIRLLASNKIDVNPMITDTLKFEDSIKAFERAAKNLPNDVKLQIVMEQ